MKIKLILLFLCAQLGIMAAETCVIKNGINPWLDRKFTIGNIPKQYLGKTVPKQMFNGRKLIVPKGTTNALIGIYEGDSQAYIEELGLKRTGFKADLLDNQGRIVLKYDILIFSNPPENLFFANAKAGVMLLGLEVEEQKTNIVSTASFKGLKQKQEFTGQKWSFKPEKRKVKMYVKEPNNGVNHNTGFMLLLHNWGGTYKQTVGWCNTLANRYNVVAISVNYLQSGERKLTPGIPYDHGYLQAMDCLRALYHVRKQLIDAKAEFSERRYYAAGGSGGGNVTLMCNKLAPNTFACVADISGMPGLTDEIAFGKGGLNAGYSKDNASPSFMSMDMQEIRNPGNMAHLKLQFRANPKNKVIIVHGLSDLSCSAADKIQIFHNMVVTGFLPDGHFLTMWNVLNQTSVQKTNHTIGNRLAVIQQFGDNYFLPSPQGALAMQTINKNDFERKGKVIYPTTNGRYIVDFSQSAPSIKFEEASTKK